MTEEEIAVVKIDADGRLCLKPRRLDFPHIYRTATGVRWDPDRCCLFAPRPQEWTYPMSFSQIVADAASEYGVRLMLTDGTVWVDVPDDLRAEISK